MSTIRDGRYYYDSQDTLNGVGDGVLEIGIVKDDVGSLTTELESDLLQVGVGGLLENFLADTGGSGESDLVDLGRGGEGVTDRGSVTDDDVDDTSGDAGLLEELGHVQGCERGELGRLDDDGVSGGESGGNLPREHVQGLESQSGISMPSRRKCLRSSRE